MIKLSILILTVSRRLETFFPKLIRHLEKQIADRQDIEILGLYDNKKRTVGEKRNELIKMARGKYLTFIDDDDRIDNSYIENIMKVIDNPSNNADCIVFDCITTINNDPNKVTYSKYGIEFNYHEFGNQWRGKPAHTMVWLSEIAKRHSYINKNYGEDINWVVRASQDIKNQIRIDKVLYYYDFNSAVSETRG